MPTTEQLVVNLRTLLASDVLNPNTAGLSDSGRLLMKYSKQWVEDFIELLLHKNDKNQIQDFIWFLAHSRIHVDATDIAKKASTARVKADTSAAYESMKTIGSLLLTNSDFRLFLQDLNVLGRQVFVDTANKLAEVAEDAAKKVEPSGEEAKALHHPGTEPGPAPTTDDLVAEAAQITDVVADGLKQVGEEAADSTQHKLTGDEKETLLFRLRNAVTKLGKRTDYAESVSTIGLLINRYAKVYSRAVDKSINAVQEDVETNEELDRAVKNAWSLLSSFGDKEAWKELENRFNKVMEHAQKDPEFETLMGYLSGSIQKMLTDPNFFESAEEQLIDLKEKSAEVGTESPLRKDIDRFLQQARTTYHSVMDDKDVFKLLRTSMRIWNILSPMHAAANTELLVDTYSIFIPLLIQAVQYVPIPRLEISSPEIDLLLENLILEPGRTINHSSFLPFMMNINTNNDLVIRKGLHRTRSSLTTLVTVNIKGLSVRADDVGFWMRAHKGLLRLADEGIASFELDERGIDVAIDFEVGKDRLEKILSLRNVKVKIHHLSYKLRKSKFACLAWVFKPLLRPIIRKVLEHQMSKAIEDALHAANRELVYARERLRATRISDPKDLRTFVKAIMTRLTPEEDPDLYTNVGITGGATERGSVFANRYAPGSVVRLWQVEAQQAGERVDDNEVDGGWRNEIFDVQARAVSQ